MPRRRQNIFHLKSKQVREVSYSTTAFKAAVEKFYKLHSSIQPMLMSLYRDSQRARGTRERLQDGRSVLIKALRILQENDDAEARMEAAMNELSNAQADHAAYDNRHSGDLVLFALKTLENEEKYQSMKKLELDKVVEEFKRIRDSFLQATEDNNFGTRLIRTTAEVESDKMLAALFRDAYHVLKSKSKNKLMSHFMKALCIWQEAYEAQRDIASAYKDERIFRLKFEADNLLINVRSEELQDQPSVYRIRLWISDLKDIDEYMKDVRLRREDSRKVREASRRLRNVARDMAALRQKIISKAGETKQRKLHGKQQRVGFKRLFTRNQRQASRNSTDLSSNASTAGSRESRARTSYPHF